MYELWKVAINIMTAIERTAYPRILKHNSYRKRDLGTYIPSLEETNYIESNLRSPQQKLNFTIQLKVFQKLGYFIEFAEVPTPIVRTIRNSLLLPADLKAEYANRTDCYRHRINIKKLLEVKSWDQETQRMAFDIAIKAAHTLNDPADIINVVLEELVKLRYELPAFSTLDRLTRKARENINSKIFNDVKLALHKDGKIQILDDFLISLPPSLFTSNYQALKQLPKRPTVKNFRELLTHHDYLLKLGNFSPYLKSIPKLKLEQFIEEAKSLDISDIKLRIGQEKKYTLLACLTDHAQKTIKDALALTLCKMISKSHKEAERELENILKGKEEQAQVLTNFLLKLSTDYRDQEEDKFLINLKSHFDEHGGVGKVIEDCEKVAAIQSNNHLPLFWRHYQSKKSLAYLFLKAMHLHSSTQDKTLTTAIDILINYSKCRREWITLEANVDLSFAPLKWHKLVYGKSPNIINKKHFEACVVSCLVNELNSGDTFIEGAYQYADYREELFSWEECIPLLDQYCQEASLPTNDKEFVNHLKTILREAAKRADNRYPNNKFLVIDNKGIPYLKKRPRKSNPQAKVLLEEIKKRLPERNLIDILCLTHKYTGWAHSFNPLSGSDPKLENPEERYIATTFCYGTSMGPNQTSRHLKSEITPHMLSWVNRRHTNLRKLDAAVVKIVDYYLGFPLIKAWGLGKRCAVDGTLRTIYDDNLLAESHIRYGAKGGVSYHHVADNYIAFFSTFMPCGVWEAVELIEGLLKNNSNLKPDTVHGDTQAQSTPVFGLAYLFNIKLMPRIRNWKDLTFFRPDKGIKYKHIDSIFGETIDWDLIQTHWQDLMQVALSVKHGKISSSLLLRKLTNYSKKNRLYKAFQELGRVIRTVFLLEYISNIDLREIITETTNKVETYHRLSKWTSFASDFIALTNSPEDMEKSIKYNAIITNSIILQNVIDMSKIIQKLRLEGWSIRKEDLEKLSPYITEHIKRFGDYVIDLTLYQENLEKLRSQSLF